MSIREDREFVLTISLPIGPSANHSFGINTRARAGKRIYTTIKAREYLRLIEKAVKEKLPEDWEPIISKDFWIVVELNHFDKGNVHSGDISNRHRLILNGLKQGLGIDDYFFLVRDMTRERDPSNPRIVVSIWKEKRNVVDIRRRRVSRKDNSS